MIALLACAALTCICALALGQAVLRLCGAPAFDWLAAPVGVAMIMLLTVPALHIPGRTITIALFVVALTIVALVWLLRTRSYRPPLAGVLASVPVLLLAFVPFLANGRVGTLGWSFNNDMATHLLLADSYKSATVAAAGWLNSSYPVGMHAWAATASSTTGATIDQAFAGVTVALPVLLGWTGLAAVRHIRWWGPFAVVPLVGFPFLIAGYFGQGSFKEITQATLVLGCAVALARRPLVRPRLRWVPFALMAAGTLSVYSYTGIGWPAAFLGVWLAGCGVAFVLASRSERPDMRKILAELASMAIGFGVLLLVTIPQWNRLKTFLSAAASTNGTGIKKTDIGNLAGPLPLWESLGSWTGPDYRMLTGDPLTTGVVAGLVLSLVLFGVCWSLRRREWILPAATAATSVVWFYANRYQSPYVAAKALVLLAPLLMIMAVRPLVERYGENRRWPMPAWWGLAAPVLAVVLLVMLMHPSYRAVHFSNVGSAAHTSQLQSMRGLFGNDPVLFLGNDDFIVWETGGRRVHAPVIGFQIFDLRPEKPWKYGRNIDFDSIPTATLNEFSWMIAPRDASASMPPPELKLVRRTPDFNVYRRSVLLPAQSILAEGDASAVRLKCDTRSGRVILRGGGVAAVRPAAVTTPLPTPIPPGATFTAELRLPAGTWDLVSPYGGPRPVEVTGPGLRTTLPANLDRPGPRWPVGRITTDGNGHVVLSVHPTKNRFTWPGGMTSMTSIIAVPVGQEKIVPIAQACGKLVDWYRPSTR